MIYVSNSHVNSILYIVLHKFRIKSRGFYYISKWKLKFAFLLLLFFAELRLLILISTTIMQLLIPHNSCCKIYVSQNCFPLHRRRINTCNQNTFFYYVRIRTNRYVIITKQSNYNCFHYMVMFCSWITNSKEREKENKTKYREILTKNIKILWESIKQKN